MSYKKIVSILGGLFVLLPFFSFADVTYPYYANLSQTYTGNGIDRNLGFFQPVGLMGSTTVGSVTVIGSLTKTTSGKIVSTLTAYTDDTYTTTSLGNSCSFQYVPSISTAGTFGPVMTMELTSGPCETSPGSYYLLTFRSDNTNTTSVFVQGGNTILFGGLHVGQCTTACTINYVTNSAPDSGVFNMYFLISSSTSPAVPDLSTGRTRIISTIPVNGQTVATSTAVQIGGLAFVSQDDNENGNDFVRIQIARRSNAMAAIGSPALVTQTFDIPVAVGILSYATTTPIDKYGQYFMSQQIIRPSFIGSFLNFFGLSIGVLDATSTVFTVDHLTGYDNFAASTSQAIADFAENGPADLSNCSLGNFDLSGCIYGLFVPDFRLLVIHLEDVKNSVLTTFPWGYFTRAYTILSNNATTTGTTLPTFTVNIPTSDATSSDIVLTYDMQEMISGGGILLASIKDPNTGQNMEDIIGPWLKLFIGLSVILVIIGDLTKMGHHNASENLYKSRA